MREWSEDHRTVLSERRCKNKALTGNSFCRHHGANSPKALEAAETAKQLTLMERFVAPYEGDYNPLGQFERDWRRTVGRIEWLESQIADLSVEDLTWGLSKEEKIGAAEFAGTNRTYETKIHVYESMLRYEREHLLKLTQVWIKMGVDQAQLNLLAAQVDVAYNGLLRAVQALGLDPSDPAVRDALTAAFRRPQGQRGYLAIEQVHDDV